MGKRLKYEVKELTHKDWIDGDWRHKPKFQLVKNGELICEMKSSNTMENIVRKRFNEMEKRFNDQPFEIDLKW